MKDFFTSYHRANARKYLSTGVLALTLSCGIVTGIHQSGPQGMILANVLEAGSNAVVSYSADLIVERSGSDMTLRLGKDAYDVDTLSLSLLGDPEKLLGITSKDASVSITSNEPGVYFVKLTKNKASYKKGEVITTLQETVSGETSIAPVDPLLTSAGQSYTLSVQSN